MSEQTRRRIPLLLLLLVGIVAIAYANTLGHRFVWDDHDIIVNNPLLRSLKNIPRILLSEDRFTESASGFNQRSGSASPTLHP